jgi:hypothetical protein
MPEELRTRVEQLAKANGRSTNAEIVAALDAATDGTSGLTGVPVEALLKAVADRMGAAVQINVTSAAAPVPAAPKSKRKKASP